MSKLAGNHGVPPVMTPCMFELVHRIALLIRFPPNRRITLKRLERRFKLTYCPLLLRDEEQLPGQCCGLRQQT